MARNEILVHNWSSEEECRHCFADGINQKLISVCRAGYFQPSLLSVLSGLQNPILFYPWVLQPPPPRLLKHIAIFLPQWKTTILPPGVILSPKSNQFLSLEEVRIYPVGLLNCSTIGRNHPTDEQSRIIRYFQLLNNLQFVYVECGGSVLSLVWFLFPFVSNSLSRITISKNEGK